MKGLAGWWNDGPRKRPNYKDISALLNADNRLNKLAKAYLSMPSSTAASERTFSYLSSLHCLLISKQTFCSLMGLVLNSQRRSMGERNIQKLMSLKLNAEWLRDNLPMN